MCLRFTIRDLLWLTLMVAMAVGWWLDHRNVVDEQSQLVLLYEQRPRLEREVQRLERFISSLNFNMRDSKFATEEYKNRLSKAGLSEVRATV